MTSKVYLAANLIDKQESVLAVVIQSFGLLYSPPPGIKPSPLTRSALAQRTVSGCTSIAEVMGC